MPQGELLFFEFLRQHRVLHDGGQDSHSTEIYNSFLIFKHNLLYILIMVFKVDVCCNSCLISHSVIFQVYSDWTWLSSFQILICCWASMYSICKIFGKTFTNIETLV